MLPMLPLLQMIDSAFPTGAFAHSFGLETALQEERVKTPNDLREWLMSYVTGSLVPMEAAGVLLAYRYAEVGEPAYVEMQMLDRRLTLSKLARESREGGVKVGKRYLFMATELYPKAGLHMYDRWILEQLCFGHSSVVHGWICHYLGQSAETAVLSHLYASVNSLVQNAMRAMAIGQTDGQKVLRDLLGLLERETARLLASPLTAEQLSSHTLSQEIAAMRHESLYSRLFMS